MPRKTETRSTMVSSAAALLREHGVRGTSFAKVLEHSGGPRGSIGYHFPKGKAELVGDAVRLAGDTVTTVLRRARAEQTPAADVFAMICAYYRGQLEATDYRAGCPVGAVGHEAFLDEDLRGVVEHVFADWTSTLAEVLVASGHPSSDAAELADLCTASIEGAILMARVTRSTQPIDHVENRIAPLLAPAS